MKCVAVLCKTHYTEGWKNIKSHTQSYPTLNTKTCIFLGCVTKIQTQFKNSALRYHKVHTACTQNMTCASSTVIPTVHGTLFRTLSMCVSMGRRVVSLMLKDI
jgi:hypothetical protein